MNLPEAKSEVKRLLSGVDPAQLPPLLHWIRTADDFEELLSDNRTAFLRTVADELRQRLPLDAMLPSESTAYCTMQQRSRPTVHVDAFLYDEDQVDSLCEEGTMSRCYCLDCGSCRTAPLGQIIIITVMSQLPANTGTSSLTRSPSRSSSSCLRRSCRT